MEVRVISDSVASLAAKNLQEISWPVEQAHLLKPHASIEGFHVDAKGRIYAFLEEGRYVRAELDSHGDYQIPWPAVPGVTAPLLKKVAGQPHWQVEADWYSTQPAPLQTPTFLEPQLAARLSRPELSPDAIRYNKLKHSFVDTADGTVMVRKDPEGYHQASANGLDSPHIRFERIAQTSLWRIKPQEPASQNTRRPAPEPQEPIAGPSKRPRLQAENDPAPHLDTRQWRAWGKDSKPWGESIEIDGKHYQIVRQWMESDHHLAFIEHPDYSPTSYNDFEQMLQTTPQRQPMGVVKNNGNWTVLDNRLPFEKSFTRYVADTYPSLSADSVDTVARRMFREANSGDLVHSMGLHTLFEVFHHWTYKNSQLSPRPDLLDPMLLILEKPHRLEKVTRTSSRSSRLSYDPQHFPLEWAQHSASPATFNLWDVFNGTLRRDGYKVSETFRTSEKDWLLFSREGSESIYLMRFADIQNDAIARGPFGPPSQSVRREAFLRQLGSADKQLLLKHIDQKSVIYLIGAKEQPPGSAPGVIVVREF